MRCLLKLTLDTFLPRTCAGCGAHAPAGVCRPCLRSFRPVESNPICFLCRRETRGEQGRLAGMGCRRPEHALTLGTAVYWMESPLDKVIHQFKYRRAMHLAAPLGRRLARRTPVGPSSKVLALPMSRARRRERGYDHIALLVKAACARWRIELHRGALRRTRALRPQADLDYRERVANVEGCFEATPGMGGEWVLVDDVATTGATLVSAMAALIRAGAERVRPLCLALA